jgi:hypothetical protein
LQSQVENAKADYDQLSPAAADAAQPTHHRANRRRPNHRRHIVSRPTILDADRLDRRGEAPNQQADFADDDALLTSLLDGVTQLLDLENGVIGRPKLTLTWEYRTRPLYNGLFHPRLRGRDRCKRDLCSIAPFKA